jgi:hypothetical protein
MVLALMVVDKCEHKHPFQSDFQCISARAWVLSAWVTTQFIQRQLIAEILQPALVPKLLAFAMARHPRLGKRSPASILSLTEVAMVCRYLWCSI